MSEHTQVVTAEPGLLFRIIAEREERAATAIGTANLHIRVMMTRLVTDAEGRWPAGARVTQT